MNFAGVQSVTIPEGDVKSIAIGGVTVWQKPNPLPYDAEVEYLDSVAGNTEDAAPYIDTGVVPTDTARFELDWIPLFTSGGGEPMSGIAGYLTNGSSGSNATRLAIGLSASGPKLYFGICNLNLVPVSWSSGSRVSMFIELNGTAATYGYNGTTATATTQRFANSGKSVLLFARNANVGQTTTPRQQIGKNQTTRICQARIWASSDVLSFDGIPVRVGSGSSAVGYLYDRVSGNLFGNAGTGSFVLGPDKNGG